MKTFFFFLIGSLLAYSSAAQSSNTNFQLLLERATENGFSGAILLASGGNVHINQGVGMADRESKRPETAATVFSVGSITKQFTAAAIMKLWSQGKLKTDDPISRFFPEAPADKRDITIHQLLTHTAGFVGALGDDYENLNATEFTQLAFSTPLDLAPGAGYQYSNVGYSLLGIIVEKISGIGYESFLREALWLPAQMQHTGYVLPGIQPSALAVGYQDGKRWGTAIDRPWFPDGPGWHLRANGGVLSTVGDMYLWYKALKNNTVLSKDATDLMFRQHVAEDPSGQSYYGYGWVVQERAGQQIIWHNGGNGVYNAFMGFDLKNDICVIVSSNSNDKISDALAWQLHKILTQNSQMIAGKLIDRIRGVYRLPSGDTFRVAIDESNRMNTFFEHSEALQCLLSDGTENPEIQAAVGERTVRMLSAIQKGDFSLIARYRDVPIEIAENRIKPFWQEMQAERGNIQGIDLIGVVSRPKMGAELAFVRVRFERNPLYFMYIWQGERIEDIQEKEILDKSFEWQGGTLFHAANNGRSIVLENEQGKDAPILLVKHPKGVIRAVKIE